MSALNSTGLSSKQLEDIKNIITVFANHPDTRDDLLKEYINRLLFESHAEGFGEAQRQLNHGEPLHLSTN